MSSCKLLVVMVTCAMVACAAPPSSHRVRRVIGGQEVEEGKWPWLVSLRGKIPDFTIFGIPITYRTFYCGGSLLGDRWVMTAAHCFHENDMGTRAQQPQYWHVHLGDVELTSGIFDRLKGFVGRVLDVDSWREWTIHADLIVTHPQYDRDSLWKNDIALIKLEDPVPTGSDDFPEIQAVQLSPANQTSFPADGQQCIMKGWGCTEGGGSVSDTARQVTLPKVSDTACGAFWRVPATMRMCAGHNLQHMGICPGDSGGPLVCRSGTNWLQVGIASFTSADRPGNVPGVFTRVSHYRDWISRVMARN